MIDTNKSTSGAAHRTAAPAAGNFGPLFRIFKRARRAAVSFVTP
jgi:hypothetical protein